MARKNGAALMGCLAIEKTKVPYNRYAVAIGGGQKRDRFLRRANWTSFSSLQLRPFERGFRLSANQLQTRICSDFRFPPNDSHSESNLLIFWLSFRGLGLSLFGGSNFRKPSLLQSSSHEEQSSSFHGPGL